MKLSDMNALQEAFTSYAKAAAALGMTPQAFNDAKRRGNLPRHLYLAQKAALEASGHEPDDALWGFAENLPDRRREF